MSRRLEALAALLRHAPGDSAVEGARELPNYLVCTPYWGNVDQDHLDSMLALGELYPSLRRHRVSGCAYIDIARATLCRVAELGGFAGVMFIDHDIVFWPPDVAQLIEAAEREQTVVSGIYGMRTTGDRMIGCFDASVKQAVCFEGGGLYKSPWSGLGFTAIPRAVLEAVGRDLPVVKTGFSEVRPMFALRVADGWYSGEDISFFHRVQQAGFQPLVDTRPRLFHKGTYLYGLEDVQVAVPRGRTLELDLVPLSVDESGRTVGRPPMVAAAAEQFEGAGPGVQRRPAAAE